MTIRLGVIRDYRAEGWPSMDLCADELIAASPGAGADFDVGDVAPEYRRVFGRVPILGRTRRWRNADRARNRYALLPGHLRGLTGRFDAWHVVDHSYAHVVDALPAGRTGVFCHDLDAFRCVLEPERDPRPRWYRSLARRVLSGFERAAIVFVATQAVARELRERGLTEARRVVHAPLGVSSEFVPSVAGAAPALPWLDALADAPFVLHVGSAIPRKRLDVLLEVFAAVRTARPDLRLVKVGGEWTREQRDQLARLGVGGAVVHATGLSRLELAEVYRRAGAVVVTSDGEGFGLPVVEALACGAPVVASDLPALRESGGTAAAFCAVGDVAAFAAAVERALAPRPDDAARAERLAWAGRFTWAAHARTILGAYRELLRA